MRLRPAGGNQWTHIGCGTESLLVCFPVATEAYNFDQLETLSIAQISAYVSSGRQALIQLVVWLVDLWFGG